MVSLAPQRVDLGLDRLRRSRPAGAKRQSPLRDLGPPGTPVVVGIRLLSGGAAVKHVYIQLRLCDLLLLNCTYMAALQLCVRPRENKLLKRCQARKSTVEHADLTEKILTRSATGLKNAWSQTCAWQHVGVVTLLFWRVCSNKICCHISVHITVRRWSMWLIPAVPADVLFIFMLRDRRVTVCM